MDQPNQSDDPKVILIWVGIGVAALLIVLVIIALIIVFVRARRRLKALDEDIQANSLRRSIIHHEENERIKHHGIEMAFTESVSRPSSPHATSFTGNRTRESAEVIVSNDAAYNNNKQPTQNGSSKMHLSGTSLDSNRTQNDRRVEVKQDRPNVHKSTDMPPKGAKPNNTRKVSRHLQRACSNTSSDTDSEKANLTNSRAGKRKKSRVRTPRSTDHQQGVVTSPKSEHDGSSHTDKEREGSNDSKRSGDYVVKKQNKKLNNRPTYRLDLQSSLC